MKKVLWIICVLGAVSTMSAQVKLRHGLLLGGGMGSIGGVEYALKGYGTEYLSNIQIISGISNYKYNASLGYKFRIENDESHLFYDVDFGFGLKNIDFDIKSMVDENGYTHPFQSSGSHSTIDFFLCLSANYKIYSGLYAGLGIEPTYYFHDMGRFIRIFDTPIVGKIGYDFKKIDIVLTYKKGLFNALKSNTFAKGQINDIQLQLFIPF